MSGFPDDWCELHMLWCAISNLVNHTESPRCHFSWPFCSALLNKDGSADIYVVVTEYMSSRTDTDCQLNAVVRKLFYGLEN